jgi:hypothetical protein
MISHQTWFCANPFSGRFRSPVSFAAPTARVIVALGGFA